MSEITITINGKVCKGSQGDTIFKIAKENGIYIRKSWEYPKGK